MLEKFRRHNSKSITTQLYDLFCKFGFPESLSSNNATVFVSEEFRSFLYSLRINHIPISPYHAEANIAERFVKTLKSSMRAYFSDSQSSLPVIQYSLNLTERTGL